MFLFAGQEYYGRLLDELNSSRVTKARTIAFASSAFVA